MAKKMIFEDSLHVAGIMCFNGCSVTIRNLLDDSIDEAKKNKLLPDDAELMLDAEPQSLGVHRLFFTIESESDDVPAENLQFVFDKFKNILNSCDYTVIDDSETDKNDKTKYINWLNIAINLLAIGLIFTLWFFIPPSLPLTLGLAAISFLATAFSARKYLLTFFRNLRKKEIANMNTTVSLGWFLSLTHTIYHMVRMPLIGGFSMLFMGFIMPPLLITCINVMDEIKRQIMQKSKKMHLKGMQTLFPQMAEEYACYPLEPELIELFEQSLDLEDRDPEEILLPLQDVLSGEPEVMQRKNLLKKGMIICVEEGECFPVDCILVDGHTIVDASLLTGESLQNKKHLDFVPAGAVNRGKSVRVFALKNSYNSTINQILFHSNRANENARPVDKSNKFAYLYATLIIISLAAAIIAPPVFGILSFSLLLQSITGILFFICPCSIVIAYFLPFLLATYQRNKHGILLRDESIDQESYPKIDTVVFDKTGTLTTGNSQVASFEGISPALWDKICLLEEQYGANHPLAKAITEYHGKKANQQLFNEVKNVVRQSNGIKAEVAGVQIHLGNREFLINDPDSPIEIPPINNDRTEEGLTPVYIAEDNVYKGVIYIKHEVREDIIAALTDLKSKGIKIMMLTGDNEASAIGFNRQIGSIFEENDPGKEIFAGKTPEGKEEFLKELMPNINPKGLWFVGDGINDAPCSRLVSERGGISCAITSNEKAAFFTDISLNGSLDYLFVHHEINHSVKKNVMQNQGLLALSTLFFLGFLLTFSFTGIAVSPIIPLMLMLSTTFYLSFNSYRSQLAVDVLLNKNSSWAKKLLASDLSITLLVGASTLLITSVLIATVITGGLALPFFTFTAGAALAVSSAFTLSACVLFGCFAILASSHFLLDKQATQPRREDIQAQSPQPIAVPKPRLSNRLPVEPREEMELNEENFEEAEYSNHQSFIY